MSTETFDPETDKFFFQAFQETTESVQTTELVNIPEARFSKQDYIARILCNNRYLSQSEEFPKAVGQFLEASRETGEWNSAMIKTLRAIFSLDGKHEPRYVEEQIPNDRLQERLNRTMLDVAMNDMTQERYYTHGKSFYEELVNAAREVDYKFGLVVARIMGQKTDGEGDGDGFEQTAYDVHRYTGDTLEQELQKHDRDLLSLRDVEVHPGIEDIAQVMLDNYLILHNKGIREQIVDGEELCYTICAGFAPEVVVTPEYRQGIIEVVKGQAPAKIKFITAMMAIAHDNFLRVLEIGKNTTLEGYNATRET